MHIINCAKLGADVATCPLNAITDLLEHPLTDIGLEKFLTDAKKFAINLYCNEKKKLLLKKVTQNCQ